MLGPSGFFLPPGTGAAEKISSDLELIHTSEDGFNELYRVCKNGRFFVYKALKKEFRGNLLYEELLTKDFDIGFSLNNSGICQYLAKITHPEIGSCIVMEWIDGCTLEELIASRNIDNRLSEKILCEICEALDYMHRKQVIHRDLKPENILITHNGQNVKIIDFGLSDTDSHNTFKSPAGTRIYASPELIAGENIDFRTDIWSLGVIINEIDPRYRRIASVCLSRERDKRYGSASEVKKAILGERSRKRRATFGYIAVAISVISAIFIMTSRQFRGEMTIEKEDAVITDIRQQHAADVSTDSSKTTTPDSSTMIPKTKPAAKPSDLPQAENIDAAELEVLLNDAAQSIL